LTQLEVVHERVTPSPSKADPTRRVAPWLPAAWVALFFISSFRFTGSRSVEAAVSGSASAENGMELAVFGAIGVVSALRLLFGIPKFRPAGIALLSLYSLLALASTTWSVITLFSLVRASQFVALSLFVAASASMWSSGQRSLESDWRRIWGTYLLIVVAASAAGFIWPNWQGPGGARYSWPGIHTGTTGEYLALGAMVALSMLFEGGWNLRRRTRRLLPIFLIGAVVLLILTITRSALAAFLVGSTLVVARASRIRPDRKLILAGVFASVLVCAFAWFWEPLSEYLLRGQSVDQFTSLTGRVDLWAFALSEAQEAPFFGFGLGSARVVLTKAFFWGGVGHSLWIETILSIGLIGATLLTTLLVWMLIQTHLIQRIHPGPVSNLGFAYIAATLVWGISSSSLALPGLGLAVVGLILAAMSSSKRERPAAPAEPGDPAS